MKRLWTGVCSFLLFLGTVGVALAAESKEGGTNYLGYEGIYLIWKGLALLILVWGAYDSFFRPIDPPS